MKTLIAVVLTTLNIWGAAVALADNDESSTPSPPAAPPAPAPVVATGGANTGTSPGTSCVPHLGLRNEPPSQSAMNIWQTNGDAGWPFGWPGVPPLTMPTIAPTVSCSR
jgi:hypothetical protein